MLLLRLECTYYNRRDDLPRLFWGEESPDRKGRPAAESADRSNLISM